MSRGSLTFPLLVKALLIHNPVSLPKTGNQGINRDVFRAPIAFLLPE